MTYNCSLCFYTLFFSFRAQSIKGKCTSRHLFSYGGLEENVSYVAGETPRGTLRSRGDKTHCFPWGQSLSTDSDSQYWTGTSL